MNEAGHLVEYISVVIITNHIVQVQLITVLKIAMIIVDIIRIGIKFTTQNRKQVLHT